MGHNYVQVPEQAEVNRAPRLKAKESSMQQLSEVTLRDISTGRRIARVGLNGYRSLSCDANQESRRAYRLIWSFTVLDGDVEKLRYSWERLLPVLLCTTNGRRVPVKIVAMPIEDGYGIFEFPQSVTV